MINSLCEKEVELLGDRYIVYLKEVASKLDSDGKPLATCVKAYVKKI